VNIDYSLIISLGALMGVLLTAIRLLSYLTHKAKEEGMKEQQMVEVQRDIAGIGVKVNTIEQSQRKTSDKVIELESKIVTKLDVIEGLLKSHIGSHNNG
jgi:uncharacterized protein YdeI (BOF family)